MPGRVEQVRSVARSVYREVRREDVTFMAASIAYHAFVSMLPILLLLTLVVTTVGSEQFVEAVVELLRTYLPAAGRDVVSRTLREAAASTGVSVVGFAVLLWGTSKIFRAMDAAFAELYDTERELSLVGQLRDALVVLAALAVAALVAILVGTYVRIPEAVPLSDLLNGLVAVLGLTVAFFPMYYVFPDVDVSVRTVVPGVLVAAVGWVVLEQGFSLYAHLSNKPDAYGVVGTLLLLVTWLYVGGLVLLVGAAVNATLAGRTGDRAHAAGGKRRFGRRVTDLHSFERHLDELLDRADRADVSRAAVEDVLRHRANGDDTPRADAARAGDDGPRQPERE